jgi:transcriptional regulator with XRE-family HTH domain
MSPAEFITLRQACGLTQQEAGEILGVAHRTVQNWEGARNAIPKSDSDGLRNLDDLIRAQASAVLEPLARKRPGSVAPVQLVRYRSVETFVLARLSGAVGLSHALPWPAHIAVLWRVMDGLSRLGIRYSVQWAEDQAAGPADREGP